MAKSDRLLQTLQLLRTLTPPVRASDLAEALGISLRSVYRDIDSLRAAGAGIEGEAEFGYTLTEAPALPPMMFSRDEMEALVLGLREVREVADPVLSDAARNALTKVRASLPDRLAHELEHSVLYAKKFHDRPVITIDMVSLRQATRDEWKVWISYSDAKDVETERLILP